MYVSYTVYDGVWEDKEMYAAARREADDFFGGRMSRPCDWLKSRNIGQVYWDDAGTAYGSPEAVKGMGFLDKMYQGGNVALYSVGPCGENRR